MNLGGESWKHTAFFAEQVVKQWDPLSQESHKCLGLHGSWLRSWTGSWEEKTQPFRDIVTDTTPSLESHWNTLLASNVKYLGEIP